MESIWRTSHRKNVCRAGFQRVIFANIDGFIVHSDPMFSGYQTVELNIVCVIVVTVAIAVVVVEVLRMLFSNRKQMIIWSMLLSCDVGVGLWGTRS